MAGPAPARRASFVLRALVCASIVVGLPTVLLVSDHGGGTTTVRTGLVAAAGATTTTTLPEPAPGGQPTCPPPPLPAPTFPGKGSPGFGIPFRAALTGGEVLGGWDEQWHNNGSYTPWKSSITRITGWVVGELQVPKLNAVVAPSGITFCDGPTDPRILVVLNNGDPSDQGSTPAPPKSNSYTVNDPAGCPDPKGGCADLNYYVTLAPVGAPSLSVAGVDANGALELSGSATAFTTVTFPGGNGSVPQDCVSYANTTLNVGTTPKPEPSTAPPGVTQQLAPAALTGALPSTGLQPEAHAVLADDAFALPLLNLKSKQHVCPVGIVLDQVLAGSNAKGVSEYFAEKPPPKEAPPGWSQFSITATIQTLSGVQVGPQGFKL